ncbi:transcriptional regulator, LacI family [Nakamurella panacisegetis]|uniref:Transcriptional regulator, LacI family n=1 Tax=Nakamurella panacisegetis TaxID=1090615 RepID=A0A1H0N5P5_9ACTN|nr:LacI family DNA-binding transcriptional regulator [Nakamurella panacisegetis]SDO88039.1 transcriptional regulator, LacI family [Nakamurella panacisegetis]
MKSDSPRTRADGPGDDGTDAPKSATIYDVARKAGVAASTVSRAFARPGRVNAVTAERIRGAAESLGYRANPLARALPTGRTSIIAFTISDVANPFYAEIIRGAQAAAAEAGFTMVLADGQESEVLEREALERVIPIVDGIVLATSRMSDAAIKVTARQKPMVVLNRSIPEVPSLTTDNQSGVRQVVEYLLGLGHRSVTYVAGPEASWADGARWRALLEVGAKLKVSTRRIGPFAPTVHGGREAATHLMSPLPSAVLAYNDQVAIGVINQLAEAGIVVPTAVSVIGFDDIFASSLITPALTTVAAPLQQMGVIAVRNLLAVINGAQPRAGGALVVPTHLIERGSAGPARHRKDKE